MVTLTVSHSSDDELAVVLGHLDAGWVGSQRGSARGADRQRFGIRGHLRITEIVHQDASGWHPHFHVLLFRDPMLAGSDWGEVGDRLMTRFLSGVRAAGGAAELAGQHLAVGNEDGQGLVRYCLKGPTVSSTEHGRPPVALLADLRATGEGIDVVKEFDTTMSYSKHRRYSPSTGLQQHLDVQ